MKIGIASDHGGYLLKSKLIENLKKNYEINDYGTYTEDSTDYPIYAFKLCEEIGKNVDFGILICTTGIGISIAANKVKGIRCAKVSNLEEAELSRSHNNANVIALSAKLDEKLAIEIVQKFLITPFSNGERHVRRIKEIEDYENEH